MTESAMLERAESKENLSLRLTRVIKAKRDRVFAAWTRPELLKDWFAPGNMKVAEAATDLRVGGAYRITMRGSTAACEGDPEDTDMSRTSGASGVYREIIPNELLCFTWRGDWNPEEETLVTVALRDVEGGTELTLTHQRFMTEESAGRHQQGWTGTLEKLSRYCER